MKIIFYKITITIVFLSFNGFTNANERTTLTVSSQVLDTNRQAIQGASVDRIGTRYPETQTDNESRSVVSNNKVDLMVLTAGTQGYASDLKQITVAEDIADIEFIQEKGAGPTGIVQLPDGSLAEGAKVILCTSSSVVFLENGRFDDRKDTPSVTVRTDGKFSFPAQADPNDPYLIVVLHEQGYAQVPDDELANSSEIVLQPWATVHGKLMIGNEPGVGVGVALLRNERIYREFNFYSEYRSTTDENGNFIFNRVIPGQLIAYREIKIQRSSWFTTFSTHSISLEVKAGQTIEVAIGGTGRPITGKIQVPDYLQNKFSWSNIFPRVNINSPNNPYSNLSFMVDEDGSFRIDDVPAGNYDISLVVWDSSEDRRIFPAGNELGTVNCRFIVPEMSSGRSDEPLDLGILDLEVHNKDAYIPSLIGKSLPAIEEFNIGLSQADTESKMILLCFFDYEQRPSRNCIMQLSKRAQELKSQGIEFIAVQASKIEQEKLDEWIKESNIDFPIGMIEAEEEKIRFNWGVKSLPWLILTDKNHVVTAEGFAISELNDKIGIPSK